MLKNNWSISGSGYSLTDFYLTTNWYSDAIVLPQITITHSNSNKTPKEMGPHPEYYVEDIFNVNIWYRPSSESNTSYGTVKNAIFQIKSEIERIVRSGSPINDLTPPITSMGLKNFWFSNWTNLTDTGTRPVLFRTQTVIKVQRYSNIT